MCVTGQLGLLSVGGICSQPDSTWKQASSHESQSLAVRDFLGMQARAYERDRGRTADYFCTLVSTSMLQSGSTRVRSDTWKMVMLRSMTMFCANLKAAMSGRPQGP